MTNITKESILLSWREEKNSAFLYKKMAAAEEGRAARILFEKLQAAAEAQAKIWEQKLLKLNATLPAYSPNLRTRFVGWMILHVGPRAMKPILAAMKVRGLSLYLGDVPGHPNIKPELKLEPKHQIIQRGVAIRAAVFGINDGLVSNASLILGVAGATTNTNIIILTGIAGLCAGAFSMAAGEYISMRSQTELFEYQIALERAELEEYPEEEAQELSLIYQARGLSQTDADDFSKKLLANHEHGLNTLAREELGLNPDELGSPWIAAISSFLSFAVGAFTPLLPFFLFEAGLHSLIMSIVVASIALLLVGISMSLFTGKNAWYSGFRMLLIGGMAGATTFVIGKIIGVNV